MSDSTTAAPDVNTGVPETPEASDNPWSLLDALNDREGRFVRAALQGKEWMECAAYADVTTELGVIRMLGRPHVRQALTKLAPLASALDSKRGAKIMLPYTAESLVGTLGNGSDAQRIAAAKEIVALSGIVQGRNDRIAAGLMDVLGAVERRLSARTVDAEVVKVPELPAPVSDSESPTPIGIATIPDAAGSSSQAAPATGASKRPGRRGRRGTKPSP